MTDYDIEGTFKLGEWVKHRKSGALYRWNRGFRKREAQFVQAAAPSGVEAPSAQVPEQEQDPAPEVLSEVEDLAGSIAEAGAATTGALPDEANRSSEFLTELMPDGQPGR